MPSCSQKWRRSGRDASVGQSDLDRRSTRNELRLPRDQLTITEDSESRAGLRVVVEDIYPMAAHRDIPQGIGGQAERERVNRQAAVILQHQTRNMADVNINPPRVHIVAETAETTPIERVVPLIEVRAG